MRGVAKPVPFDPAESEWLTRKRLIDPRLRAAGWRVVPYDEVKPLTAYDRCAIEEYPTDNGPADYALCVSGEILGVVEAKKLTLGPQGVLPQAERYSKGIKTNPSEANSSPPKPNSPAAKTAPTSPPPPSSPAFKLPAQPLRKNAGLQHDSVQFGVPDR
jgi:hypothetical protein